MNEIAPMHLAVVTFAFFIAVAVGWRFMRKKPSRGSSGGGRSDRGLR